MTLDDLKVRLKPLADRIDALSLRERGIIFVAILGALYFVAVNLLFTPIRAEQDRLQKQLQSKREQTQLIENQVQIVVTGGVQGADVAKRERLNALQTNLSMIDEALKKVTTGLVPPKEMARLVELVLVKNKGLQVIKVESLPAAPLIEENPAPNPNDRARGAKAGSTPAAGLMVYKHGMRIELKGSYMDILRYLHALEDLPWKVFWGQATLQTEEYPASKLTLLIYTLSTQDSWITL
jgi:MSHA biogenesis protein MshJ